MEFVGSRIGGANRDRTGDLLHAMQALSQLSYSPTIKGRRIVGLSVCFVKFNAEIDPYSAFTVVFCKRCRPMVDL
jgi:hypothetical protein